MVDSAFRVFYELPDLVSPVPQVNTPSPECIGLIPLFADAYFGTNNFPAYFKAAIYSRQNFLLHTDAHETQTALKLYIEKALESEVLPVLRQNGLDPETDVLWFDVPPLPDTLLGTWSKYGKKTNLFFDPQLSSYKRVIFWDADLFIVNAQNIFACAADETDFLFLRTSTLRRRDWRPLIIRNTVKNVCYSGLTIQEIFTRAGLGRTLQAIPGDIVRPLNAFGIYPAKRFHSEHRPFVEWMFMYAPYIGDDEFCVALGSAKFNIAFGSLKTLWGLTSEHIGEYLTGKTETAFVHGRTITSQEDAYTQLLLSIT